jgi:hypothetical protein
MLTLFFFQPKFFLLEMQNQTQLPAAKPAPSPRINLRPPIEENTKQCLLIGNSLTAFNLMPHMLEKFLFAATGKLWLASNITRGGADLRWHRESGYADRALDILSPIDVVVLQDQSRRPAQDPEASEADFLYWAKAAESKGARVLLYLTWNLLNEEPILETMQNTLSRITEKTSAKIAPAGRVWEKFRQDFPEVGLYCEDGKHPNAMGSLLVAAVLCRSISGTLPQSCPTDWFAGGYEDGFLPEGIWERLKTEQTESSRSPCGKSSETFTAGTAGLQRNLHHWFSREVTF